MVKLLEHDAKNLSLGLEYIGPNLAEFVDAERLSQLPEGQQGSVWMNLVQAMCYLHAQQIFHRDIKPENVLLRANGGAVLCDFGISAKAYDRPEEFNGGTPCYVPPEALTTLTRGFTADVWALGITMLFVFRLIPLPQGRWKIAYVRSNGKSGQRMVAWILHIRQLVENLPSSLSPLRKMLAEDSAKRITAADLVNACNLRQYAPLEYS